MGKKFLNFRKNKMKVFAGLVASALASPVAIPAIIGGKDATDGQFPHQVSLKRASGSHYCGGSVINTNKVMCAAHCKQSSNNFTAGAGSAEVRNQRQVKNASSQTAHPQYNSNTIDYDYMVITVSSDFTYDEFVKPIALVAPSDSEVPNGTQCQSSGYGYWKHVNGNPTEIAPTLQWMDIDCITIAECKKVWRIQTLGPRQQCANSNGVTSCMGDSGGPLTTMENGQQVLLGNVSWGHGKCVTDGYPAAYSRNQDPTVNEWIKTNAGL